MAGLADTPGLAWLLAGLALMIAEVVAPGAFMVWLGLAGIGAGLVTLISGIGFGWQVIVFALLAGLAVAAGLRMRRRRTPKLNTQQAGLVGRRATALVFDGHRGRVRLGDSDWQAETQPGASAPEPGSRLVVVGVSGTTVIVRPDA